MPGMGLLRRRATADVQQPSEEADDYLEDLRAKLGAGGAPQEVSGVDFVMWSPLVVLHIA